MSKFSHWLFNPYVDGYKSIFLMIVGLGKISLDAYFAKSK